MGGDLELLLNYAKVHESTQRRGGETQTLLFKTLYIKYNSFKFLIKNKILYLFYSSDLILKYFIIIKFS